MNDELRIGRNKTPNPFILKIIYFGMVWGFAFMVVGFLKAIVDKSKENERHSKKYRKVIKEGILWDSVEYHER